MSEKRFVVDSNVLISSALSLHGNPRKAVYQILSTGLLLASAETFEEFRSRLLRSKFDRWLPVQGRHDYISFIRYRSYFVEVTERIIDCIDPDDNKFLELALSGNADYIISGDRKHLLPMHPYRGISILSPASYLELVGKAE